jgi:hypothetical protein
LTLNPRNLWLHEDKVMLFEFGLVSLLGLPQPAGPFNARYAAPELFDKGNTQKADQFSLALIYAELLTGLHPRPSRAAIRSAGSRGQAKFNLDLLPAFDRPIIAKALHHDPRQRFASSVEFVRALEQASQAHNATREVVALPSRLPLAALLGQTGPSGSVWPSDEYVKRWILLETGADEIASTRNLQYLVKPGNIVEHRCPIRMIPGGLNLKLHDFPSQWQAIPLRQEDNAFVCRIPAARTIWQRCFGKASGMEIHVLLETPEHKTSSNLVEAVICIKPYGPVNARLSAQINEIGPALIDSVRNYLQAEHSQRSHVRWPCTSPVHVYPVLPDLQVGARIEGTARDISVGGLCLRLSQAPPSDHAYINLPAFPTLAASAVLVNILRQRPVSSGWFDVAGNFAVSDSSRTPAVAK